MSVRLPSIWVECNLQHSPSYVASIVTLELGHKKEYFASVIQDTYLLDIEERERARYPNSNGRV